MKIRDGKKEKEEREERREDADKHLLIWFLGMATEPKDNLTFISSNLLERPTERTHH